jgi:hypothetical protein
VSGFARSTSEDGRRDRVAFHSTYVRGTCGVSLTMPHVHFGVETRRSVRLFKQLQGAQQPSVDAENSQEGICHVPAVLVRIRVK